MYIVSFSFTVSPVLFLFKELLLVCLQVVHFSFPPLVVSIIATSQANTGQFNFVFQLEILLKGINLDKIIWKTKPLFPLKKWDDGRQTPKCVILPTLIYRLGGVGSAGHNVLFVAVIKVSIY